MLAGIQVGIEVVRAVGSETNPDTVGRAWAAFTRTGNLNQPLNVSYSVRPVSTATPGQDYRPLSGVFTIPAGFSRFNLPIRPIDDAIVEGPEVIVMTLSDGRYTQNPAKNAARFYITDNDTAPPPTVSVAVSLDRAVASEANPVNQKAVLSFNRTGSTSAPLNVYYSLTGTATPGQDYHVLPGFITIPAGQSNATLDITAIDDLLVEPAEWGRLTIASNPAYTIDAGNPNVLFYIASNDTAPTIPGWWNDNWHYRTAVNFDSGSYARTDKPFVANLNFSDALSQSGGSGSVIPNSIRVVETNPAGTTIIDANVPFQFDSTGNNTGQIVVIATGNTPVNTTRHYHVYFDTQGNFGAASVTAQVITTDNVQDAGQNAVRIQTPAGTYFYQKANGGFSSILDPDGQDWLGFNPTPGSGSAGEYRGLPNSVFPGGGFHAGFNNATTTILSQGPLRTVLRTNAQIDRGQGAQPWSMTWEIFPTYATCNVTQVSGNYWFLYEGTPGGSISGNDYVTRAGGTTTGIGESWTDNAGLGSANNNSWVYIGDGDANRYFFLAQNQADNLVDSYYLMEGNMTVFGFGRDGGNSYINTPQRFTIGLAEGGTYAPAATLINGAYRDVAVSVGSSQGQ